MVRVFFVAIALAVGVNPEPAPPPAEQSPTPVPDSILAVLYEEAGPGSELARVDPLSLKPAGRRVVLATGGGWATAFSPDYRKLALSGGLGLATVELVDVRRMRSLGVVDLKTRGTVSFLSWQPLGYLFAVVEDQHAAAVVTIDPVGRGVQARHRIDGMILQAKSRTGQAVLLLGPRNRIGPLRLAVVGGKGMTSTPIPGFVGGSSTEASGQDVHTREEIPALVIDEVGRRALVVSGRRVAAISLRNLSVTEHTLTEPVSLLGRVRNWLEPAAQAKLAEGYSRTGAWLGDGRFAVTGMDYADLAGIPAPLTLIDTQDWTMRAVGKGGAALAVVEDALLLFGFHRNDGVRGYDFEGEERFHLLRGQGAWVQVVRGLAYAQIGDGRRIAVIDPARGRKIAEAKVDQPVALVEG
jgi:hypothetical protein